jgi:hypothetical protein
VSAIALLQSAAETGYGLSDGHDIFGLIATREHAPSEGENKKAPATLP